MLNITAGEVYTAIVMAIFIVIVVFPLGITLWGIGGKLIKKLLRVAVALAFVVLWLKGISLISQELSWSIYGIGMIIAAVIGWFFFQIVHSIWKKISKKLKDFRWPMRIAVICITLAILLVIVAIIIYNIM